MSKYMTMALLGVSSAQQEFSADLKCGMCIKSGYTFCVKGVDGQVFEAGVKPEATCCEDDTCAEVSDAAYTCSDTYLDQDYGLTMCPQKKGKCGDKQELELEEGDTETVEVAGLELGETCTYKVKSNCGSPAFKLQDGATDGLDFTFLEFEDDEAEETKEKGKGKGKRPKDGMPSRDQSFEDSGNQGKHGGQKRPPRMADDGTIEDGEYIEGDEEESADGETAGGKKGKKGKKGKGGKPDKMRGGDGKPTKGKYDATQGGYKTFGTEGQGKGKKGSRGGKEKCKNRQMYVTVTKNETAPADTDAGRRMLQSEDSTTLEFGAFSFMDDDGAMQIGGAFAAVAVAMISYF